MLYCSVRNESTNEIELEKGANLLYLFVLNGFFFWFLPFLFFFFIIFDRFEELVGFYFQIWVCNGVKTDIFE